MKYAIRLRIAEVMQDKQISQGKLSRLADVDPKTLQRLRGDPTSDVTLSTLLKLANALQVDPKDLIESSQVEE